MFFGFRTLSAAVLFAFHGTLHAVAPPADYRPPVISKIRIVFSLVTHHSHIADRVSYYNSSGSPKGNANYAVPHLVYEPVVTLYNPYDTPLTLTNVRIKIWDPPVGFRFKKNQDYLREEWGNGEYHGINRFNVKHESSLTSSKTFTLHLQNQASGEPASAIVIQPGRTKTFSTYLEPSWTWGVETAGGFEPRSLYDWSPTRNFTNIDGNTGNVFGVECAPGWDTRGGFKTDHLSYRGSLRPAATRYAFETGVFYGATGWVAIKLTDTVTVESRALRTAPLAADSDFRVDLLAGQEAAADDDIYRSFKFNVAPLVQPGGDVSGAPSVSRTYLVQDLLQVPNDLTVGGKRPFAVFTMVAKAQALMNGDLESVTASAGVDANHLYDLRFDEMETFSPSPGPGPLSDPPSIVTAFSASASGDLMTIDVVGPESTGPWKVEGGATPDAFPDDMTPESTIINGPDGTGIRKVTVDIGGKGPSYFLRVRD